MSSLPWYVARSAGIVSWGLLALSVIWGLALSTRALGRRPRANWLLDLHRFLGGLAVIFVGVHLVGLLFDSWVDIGLRQMLVPFTSSWNPLAVSFGVVALYLLFAIELTSLVRNRIPKRFWKGIHLTSYGLYVVATVHMFTAGSDAGSQYLQWAAVVATAVIVFFTAYRVMGPDKAGSVQSGGPAGTDRLAAARAAAARERIGASPR
jgi:DMSO/TMAO reductase YedYZ heme-binding membrane subunit